MICVSIGRTRHKMVVAEHRALAESGAELVELRLDWLSRQPDLSRLVQDRPTAVVVTCRREADKGRWRGGEPQRQALLRQAIVDGVEYVDLEDDVAASIPRYGETKRIVSHHDFDHTPPNLEEIHSRLCKLDPDVVKLVTMANKPSDSVRMLEVVRNSEVPTVGFCMGEFGVPSRILCGKFGSPFTYASFSRERELAPGQIPFDDMQRLYRFDEIGPDTKVFGVVGDPIGHSLSPLIHNRGFAHDGFDGVYLPFRVPKGDFAETLEAFGRLDVRGYSVTIPHKEEAARFAARRDDVVTACGAANTLVQQDGWRAANTDQEAALASIRIGLSDDGEDNASLAGRHVLVLGAGGVSRGIASALIRVGAVVTLTNRTAERAAELAAELGCRHIGWDHRATGHPEVIVNGTSVGMHPDVDTTPFEAHWFREGALVFDTVYNPENTLLLKQARERGCRTVSGIEMFTRQAAAQYEMFTGSAAPLDVMRESLRQGISAVQL